jgi:hypothetical protein
MFSFVTPPYVDNAGSCTLSEHQMRRVPTPHALHGPAVVAQPPGGAPA